jgi:RNA polymerase sigma-B factor
MSAPDLDRVPPETAAPGSALEDLDAAACAYAAAAVGAGPAERSRLRDSLVEHCLPFAARMARRYRGRGEPLDDLEQVARLGLVKAVDRYDPDRGSFTAYAVITISGEIKRHFRDRTWGVHVPRRMQDLSLEAGRAARVLTAELSRSPTVAELAGRLNVTESEILEARASAAGHTPASLNAPAGGHSPVEMGENLGAADVDLESVDDRLTVDRLLLRLPVRERQMLAMRFYGNRTQAEIAAELGISQMHVSRLLSRALSWLREAMLSDVPPRWEGSTGEQGGPVSATRDAGGVTVRVRGEVDRDNSGRLRAALQEATAMAGTDRLTVDLTGVPLVDAAGVAILVDAAAAATAAGGELVLHGVQPYVARILAVAGLAALLRRP